MKRKFPQRAFGCLLVLALSLPAFGQLSIKMGITGGQNHATFRGDLLPANIGLNSINLKSKSGIMAGGFMKVTVLGTFALQPELLYSQKGVAFDGRLGSGTEARDVEGRLKVSYLEIPILGRFEMSLLPMVSLNFYGGPAFSFKISEGSEFEEAGQVIDTGLAETNFFQDRDSGIVLGAGLSLSPASLGLLFIDARYTIGTDPILLNTDPGNPQIKNNVFTLSVGIGM